MRILMVTQFYAPTIGGQERVVEDLSMELVARGHHVSVVALQQGGQPPVSDEADVRVYRIGSTATRFFRGYSDPERPHAPPAIDPKAAAELRRVIKLEMPDIVHGHDWLIHSFLPLKRRGGPGLVVTLHDHGLVCANKRLIRYGQACTGPGPAKCLRCAASHYGLAKGPAIAVGNWAMSAAERALVDLFLPVSEAVAEAAGFLNRADRHRVIPNFLPKPMAAAPGDQRLSGLPREFIFFAGDVARDKGIAVLLEAHGQLDDPPPLVLMGRVLDPELLVPTIGTVRAYNPVLRAAPIGTVRAVGAQPHEVVLDAFRRCTVAVVPSLMPEAFGLVALEAMTAGRPVIASNTGGLRDIITDDENGILVAPGDVEALRAALARILEDSSLRERIGAAAQARAEDFSADRVAPQVEEAYADVLAARRSPRPRRRPVSPGALTAGIGGIGVSLRRGGSATIPALMSVSGRARAFGARASAELRAGVPRIWSRLQRREPRVVLALTALGVAGTAIPTGTWLPARALLVLPLVLVLPGYALTGAIFRHRSRGLAERMVLVLSLSLVTTALVSLLLYLTPFKLTLHSWSAALAIVIVGATATAAARPDQEPETSTSDPPRFEIRLPYRPVPIAIAIAAAGLIAAAVVLARTPLPSSSSSGYTALWLTRDTGSAALILGVRSEEHRRTRYVLRLLLGGRIIRRQLALTPGETWQERLPAARHAAASLYRVGRPGIYRSVRLGAASTTSR